MKSYEFNENWPAPNEYLLELGRMTSIWGTLEVSVDALINKLAGNESSSDLRIHILIIHSNFQQRVNIISTLCEQLLSGYPHLAPYKNVIEKIETAQKIRNKFAHNAVIQNEETGNVTVSFKSARGTLKFKTETVHLNDIKEATAKIHEANCALYSLLTGVELKPIWERHK